MTLNVLHVISSLGLGGAQTCLKAFIPALPPDIRSFVYPLRSRIIDIPIPAETICNNLPNYDPRKIIHFLQTCRRFNIDIIHAHLEKAILLSLATCPFHKLPVILHEHGPIGDEGRDHNFYRFCLRRSHRRAAAIIAVSSSIADALTKYAAIPPKNITIIPNAIDLRLFSPSCEMRIQLRKQLHLEDHHIALGYVGRLDPIKGADLLIDIIRGLIQTNPNARLIIIGDGPLAPAIQHKIKMENLTHAVCFLGFQPNIHQWINAFDLALVPSRHESFGIVLLELMAMHIPVICSGVDGMTDFISQKNAIIVPTGKPDDYARAVSQLIQSPEYKQVILNNAYVTAQHYSDKNQADKIYQLYQKITHVPRTH